MITGKDGRRADLGEGNAGGGKRGETSVDSARRCQSMKYGARNTLTGRVTSVKKGDIMSLVKFEVRGPVQMASVLTTESAEELALAVGDEVQLVVKAIHVLPVKG